MPTRPCSNKFLEQRRPHRRRDPRGACARAAWPARSSRTLWLGVSEQGRASAARRRGVLSAGAVGSRRRQRRASGRRRSGANAERQDAVCGVRVQDCDRPRRGSLTFFRVYSGVRRSGDTVLVPRLDKSETIGRLVQMHANERRRSKKCAPAISRPPWTCRTSRPATASRTPRTPLTLEMMDFPEPVIAAAIEPKTAADDASCEALAKLVREDPTLRVARRRGVGPNDPERDGRAASRDRRRPPAA